MDIFSPGLRDTFGGIAALVSGRVILCLEMIGGFAGTRGGCLIFSTTVVSATGWTLIFAIISAFGIFSLCEVVPAAGPTSVFAVVSPSGIFSLGEAGTASIPEVGGWGGSSFFSLSPFAGGCVEDTFFGLPAKSFSR